jgi:hypothetical protein
MASHRANGRLAALVGLSRPPPCCNKNQNQEKEEHRNEENVLRALVVRSAGCSRTVAAMVVGKLTLRQHSDAYLQRSSVSRASVQRYSLSRSSASSSRMNDQAQIRL